MDISGACAKADPTIIVIADNASATGALCLLVDIATPLSIETQKTVNAVTDSIDAEQIIFSGWALFDLDQGVAALHPRSWQRFEYTRRNAIYGATTFIREGHLLVCGLLNRRAVFRIVDSDAVNRHFRRHNRHLARP